MFRRIPRSPSDTAEFRSVLAQSAIPTVQTGFSQVFRLGKKLGFACVSICGNQFPHNPHLVVVYCVYTAYIGLFGRIGTINRVHTLNGFTAVCTNFRRACVIRKRIPQTQVGIGKVLAVLTAERRQVVCCGNNRRYMPHACHFSFETKQRCHVLSHAGNIVFFVQVVIQ